MYICLLCVMLLNLLGLVESKKYTDNESQCLIMQIKMIIN